MWTKAKYESMDLFLLLQNEAEAAAALGGLMWTK